MFAEKSRFPLVNNDLLKRKARFWNRWFRYPKSDASANSERCFARPELL